MQNLQGSAPQPPAAASFATSDEYFQHQNFIPNNSFTSNYSLGQASGQNLFTPPSAPSSFSSIHSSPARIDTVAMSGNSQAAKIGLDARAAQLKEKLLKSRSQSQTCMNPAQSTPDPARASTTVPALNPRRTPSSLSFIPHEVPRQPAETSIPADANDIAALISSISSSAGEIPGLNITPSSDTHKPQIQQAIANGQASLPPKPPPKIAIQFPPKRTVSAQSKPPQQPNSEFIAPGKPAFKVQINPTAESSPEEGEIPSILKKDGEPIVSEKTPLKTANIKSPAVPTAPKINAQSAAVSNNRREPPRGETDQTSAQPIGRNSGSEARTPAVPKPTIQTSITAETTKEIKGNGGGQADIGGKSANPKAPGSAAEPISPDDAFSRLLALVPDVKDWLEITDYYNVDTRTRKLDRFRRGKVLAAERLRIEEEERMLMEEEELEMGLQRPTFARMTSAVSSAPVGSESVSASLLTPLTPMAVSETKDTVQANPAKRAHDEGSNEGRKEKMPRLGDAPTRSEDTDARARESERRDDRPDPRRDSQPDKVDSRPQPGSRGSSPHRRPYPPSPPRHDYHRSPPSRPREYSPHRQPRPGQRFRGDHDDFEDRHRKYDRYKGDAAHHPESPRRKVSGQDVIYPIHIDLGRKGDTRFFILKSFNEENVRRCMEDDIWTTQVQNGQVLTAAFAKCKNVILFFSINKSRAFQGYARMASAPSPDTPRPKWVNGIHWEVSHPFRVEWLSKSSVEFFRIGHLKNPYNEGAPVLVGKDGQEIEEECGAELLREMEAYAEGRSDTFLPRGGFGGKRWIKREGSLERR